MKWSPYGEILSYLSKIKIKLFFFKMKIIKNKKEYAN